MSRSSLKGYNIKAKIQKIEIKKDYKESKNGQCVRVRSSHQKEMSTKSKPTNELMRKGRKETFSREKDSSEPHRMMGRGAGGGGEG